MKMPRALDLARRTALMDVCRVIGWLLCVAIVILTFVPPNFRPVTNAPHVVEHITIFLITGVAFGVGYPNRHFVYAIVFVMFAAVSEVCQIFDPGRHARFRDFLVNVFGAWLGLFLTLIWSWSRRGNEKTGRTL